MADAPGGVCYWFRTVRSLTAAANIAFTARLKSGDKRRAARLRCGQEGQRPQAPRRHRRLAGLHAKEDAYRELLRRAAAGSRDCFRTLASHSPLILTEEISSPDQA